MLEDGGDNNEKWPEGMGEGEAPGQISLKEARVPALQHARDLQDPGMRSIEPKGETRLLRHQSGLVSHGKVPPKVWPRTIYHR